MTTHRGFEHTVMLVLGFTIVTAGVLFTLDNLHVLRAREFVRYWPVALVAIGVAQLAQAETPATRARGTIWLVVGAALLSSRLGFWPFRFRDVGPLVLVAIGGAIVWRALRPSAFDALPSQAGATISATAILGGFQRRVVSDAFQRAEMTAFMGGGKLDLREAKLLNGQAAIDVFTIMGGFEIIVPPGWRVIVEATPIMGGCDDKTRDPVDPAAPRLVIRGFIFMGGVDIKN